MTIPFRIPVPRLGLSMLEIMIAVAILATALSIMIGTIFTMHQSRAAVDEEIKVQAIAQSLVERLQGARWDDLGKDIASYPGRNAWSWHRRATKQVAYSPTMDPSITPPMQDNATRDEDDLTKLGILTERSGVPGLQVYVEYYQMKAVEIVATRLKDNPKLDPTKVWTALVGDPVTGTGPTDANSTDREIFLPEPPTTLDLSNLDPAVVMRVLVRWESSVGGTRWHEVVIARRR